MDADSIWLTIISVSIAPILGLLAGLVASYFSHRGVLEQARTAASAEARLDRKQVTDDYQGLIAALRIEVQHLREIVEQDRVTIVALKATLTDTSRHYDDLVRANTVLTLKVQTLEEEGRKLRIEYDELEDRYIMVRVKQGHDGMGPGA